MSATNRIGSAKRQILRQPNLWSAQALPPSQHVYRSQRGIAKIEYCLYQPLESKLRQAASATMPAPSSLIGSLCKGKHRELPSPIQQRLLSSSAASQSRPSALSEYDSRPMNSQPRPPFETLAGLGTTQLSPDIMLRCTIFDAAGTAKSSSGVFKKSKLCTEHGLEPRDLRKVDSRVPNLVPTILARKDSIMVNILHIRAMIKADTVLLFDSYGSSDTQLHSAFVYNLQFNLRQVSSSLPYEFRALESILVSVLDALRIELDLIRNLSGRLLEALDDDVDREKLRALLQVSRKLNSFLSRSRGVKGAVTEALENGEDMALMYLTESKQGQARTEESKMDELELLLESFDKQVEEVVAETEQIHNDMTNTQEVVELILDTNRNRLLALDLKTSMATLGMSTGTLWVGLFGMNLTSHFEEHDYAFYVSSGVAFATALMVSAFGFRYLARLRRVGLHLREPVGASKAAYRKSKYGNSEKYPVAPVNRKRKWWWPFSFSGASSSNASKSIFADGLLGASRSSANGPYTWTDEKYNQALAHHISKANADSFQGGSSQSTSAEKPSSASEEDPDSYHKRHGPLWDAQRDNGTSEEQESAAETGLGGKWDSRRRIKL